MPNRTFLSHSSKDKDAVRVIADALRRRGVDVWFDEADIRSSESFVEKIGQALHEATSIVIFIGPLGETDGKWHRKEINLAVQRSVNEDVPLHVCLLPDLAAAYELPKPLADISCVRFDERVSYETTIDKLARAIHDRDPHGVGSADHKPTPSWNASEDRTFRELLLEVKAANVAFYLGSLSWESTRILTNDVLLQLLEDASLLPAGALTWKSIGAERVVPPLETAAAYYALRHSETLAAQQVSDLVRQHTRHVPPAADEFATLVGRLAKNRRRPSNQAIVTTNFDLTVERALMRAGLDFTRVVQNVPEGAIVVETYRGELLADGRCKYAKVAASAPADKDSNPTEFNRQDLGTMDSLLANPANQEVFYIQPVGKDQKQVRECALPTTPATILFKLAGSVDIEKSCLASSDLHYECLSRYQELIPSAISECVAQNVPILLGYCATGGDCRLLRHAVLHRCQRKKRFAFIPTPDENCISEFVPSQLGTDANLELFDRYDLVRADIHSVLSELNARMRLQFR